ncbi:MAG TPA: Dabb family protein [Humisphaera sp.]|jgi:hypothetical protein|nr:Dabb family protein [Humisphaera sp.]
MLIHTVFFWLKDGSGKDVQRKLVEDCAAYLGKVPVVRQLWAGPPAGRRAARSSMHHMMSA